MDFLFIKIIFESIKNYQVHCPSSIGQYWTLLGKLDISWCPWCRSGVPKNGDPERCKTFLEQNT